MEEEGIVIEVTDGRAAVRMIESGGCQGCSAAGSCKSGAEGRVLEAVNRAGARPGQRVLVGMDSTAFMKASIFVYMTPVLFLFAGAVLGGAAGPHISAGLSVETWQALSAVLFLALSIVIIRLYDRRVKRDKKLRAVILRVLDDGGQCASI